MRSASCGTRGEGRVAELRLQEKVFACTAGFGKAVGAHGGVILSSSLVKRVLLNFARPLIYTTALPLPILAAIACSYDRFPKMTKERRALQQLLKNFDLPSPIHPIAAPGNARAKMASHYLAFRGFDVRPILSPTVKRGKERLRLSCTRSMALTKSGAVFKRSKRGGTDEKHRRRRHRHGRWQNGCGSDPHKGAGCRLLEAVAVRRRPGQQGCRRTGRNRALHASRSGFFADSLFSPPCGQARRGCDRSCADRAAKNHKTSHHRRERRHPGAAESGRFDARSLSAVGVRMGRRLAPLPRQHQPHVTYPRSAAGAGVQHLRDHFQRKGSLGIGRSDPRPFKDPLHRKNTKGESMESTTYRRLCKNVEGPPTLSERDAKRVWHPYTQMQTAPPPLAIARGKGAYLYTPEGEAYLDATSSWWVNLHGHCHPLISSRIALQAEELEHVMFGGVTHPGAIELAEKLTGLTGMDKLFYSDNGSTAVEAALKMALQFFYNRDPRTKRKKILSLEHGYHGDTFGAMSAAGRNGFNQPFWDHLFPVVTLPLPTAGQEKNFLAALKRHLASGECAAFLFEPLILGAGGMKIYSKEPLCEALRLCRNEGTLTIADEVMTGFGRTGPLFACDLLEERPDLLCLSKGITGGFLPMGATLCRDEVYGAFLSSDPKKALLHGHSYSANPLACAAALASLEELLTAECGKNRERIARSHRRFCEEFHSRFERCESIGTVLVVDYASQHPGSYHDPIKERLTRHFLEAGILLRPLGSTVYVIPPYCITDAELTHIQEQLIKGLT